MPEVSLDLRCQVSRSKRKNNKTTQVWKEMTYLIKFYSKTRDKVRERRVEAPTEDMAVKAICNYYGVNREDIREIEEL